MNGSELSCQIFRLSDRYLAEGRAGMPVCPDLPNSKSLKDLFGRRHSKCIEEEKTQSVPWHSRQ
jgi:hypothetical protein